MEPVVHGICAPRFEPLRTGLGSVGKAISAGCLLRLVEAGRVDLDAPVARYWPEFVQVDHHGR